MEAKDLRIGNLLYYNNEEKEIASINSDSTIRFKDKEKGCIGCFKIYSDLIKPIPLNEEWLLKFGFRTEESNCFELDDININTSRELMWVFTKCKNNIEIEMPEFVHQLQNLYFALTGKELAKV